MYFKEAFAFTLGNEGSFVDHPADRGGPTNWGITQGTLERWRGGTVTTADVKALGKAEAEEIYRRLYWNALQLDSVRGEAPAILLFDAGVLFGVPTVVTDAQNALAIVGLRISIDGKMGPKTVDALNRVSDRAFIVAMQAMLKLRTLRIVAARPDQMVFLQGWNNRINQYSGLRART